MNETEIAHYKTALHALRESLLAENQRGLEGTRTVMLDQQAVGRLSRMDAIQNQAMAQATQARRAQMETRITAALARIDEGEFGYCLECGDEIAPKRLALDPTIATCVSCASG